MTRNNLPKVVQILLAFTILPTFLIFYKPSFAYTLKILDTPKQINIEASSSATIEFQVNNKPNTQYYLAAGICEIDCSKIFGGTSVADTWVYYNGTGSNFYPITTDENGYWQGSVGFIANRDNAGYKGPGEYVLRVGRFTATGKSIDWCPEADRAVITINDDSFAESEKYINDITHVKQQPKGTKIQTTALVTAPPGPLGEETLYIEDDFSGIKVDLPKGYEHNIKLGDKVQVGCTIEESRGEKYIKVESGDSIAVLESNLACRNASKIATGARLDDWEGRFVEVEGEVVETSGDTFYINDGSGRIKVYIRDSTEINKQAMNRGDTARARGIISQWGQNDDGSDNYRLLLRYQEDLVVYPVEDPEANYDSNSELIESGDSSSSADTSSGRVLGAAFSLPETGGSLLNLLVIPAQAGMHLVKKLYASLPLDRI